MPHASHVSATFTSPFPSRVPLPPVPPFPLVPLAETVPLGQTRHGFAGGTAGQLEALHEKRSRLPFDLGQAIPNLLGKAAREDVPAGYAAITHSVLKSSALMSGGSSRGNALVCYAKDLSHLEALSDTSAQAAAWGLALSSPDAAATETAAGALALLPGGAGGASLQFVYGGGPWADGSPLDSPSLASPLPGAVGAGSDRSENEFRRALEALSYSSGCSPVVPLAIARARAARALRSASAGGGRAGGGREGRGHRRLDSSAVDAAAAAARAAANAAAAAAAAEAGGKHGAAGKGAGADGGGSSFANRLGKLFGLGGEAGPAGGGGGAAGAAGAAGGAADAAGSSLLAPAKALGALFSRKGSARDVSGAPSTPGGAGGSGGGASNAPAFSGTISSGNAAMVTPGGPGGGGSALHHREPSLQPFAEEGDSDDSDAAPGGEGEGDGDGEGGDDLLEGFDAEDADAGCMPAHGGDAGGAAGGPLLLLGDAEGTSGGGREGEVHGEGVGADLDAETGAYDPEASLPAAAGRGGGGGARARNGSGQSIGAGGGGGLLRSGARRRSSTASGVGVARLSASLADGGSGYGGSGSAGASPVQPGAALAGIRGNASSGSLSERVPGAPLHGHGHHSHHHHHGGGAMSSRRDSRAFGGAARDRTSTGGMGPLSGRPTGPQRRMSRARSLSVAESLPASLFGPLAAMHARLGGSAEAGSPGGGSGGGGGDAADGVTLAHLHIHAGTGSRDASASASPSTLDAGASSVMSAPARFAEGHLRLGPRQRSGGLRAAGSEGVVAGSSEGASQAHPSVRSPDAASVHSLNDADLPRTGSPAAAVEVRRGAGAGGATKPPVLRGGSSFDVDIAGGGDSGRGGLRNASSGSAPGDALASPDSGGGTGAQASIGKMSVTSVGVPVQRLDLFLSSPAPAARGVDARAGSASGSGSAGLPATRSSARLGGGVLGSAGAHAIGPSLDGAPIGTPSSEARRLRLDSAGSGGAAVPGGEAGGAAARSGGQKQHRGSSGSLGAAGPGSPPSSLARQGSQRSALGAGAGGEAGAQQQQPPRMTLKDVGRSPTMRGFASAAFAGAGIEDAPVELGSGRVLHQPSSSMRSLRLGGGHEHDSEHDGGHDGAEGSASLEASHRASRSVEDGDRTSAASLSRRSTAEGEDDEEDDDEDAAAAEDADGEEEHGSPGPAELHGQGRRRHRGVPRPRLFTEDAHDDGSGGSSSNLVLAAAALHRHHQQQQQRGHLGLTGAAAGVGAAAAAGRAAGAAGLGAGAVPAAAAASAAVGAGGTSTALTPAGGVAGPTSVVPAGALAGAGSPAEAGAPLASLAAAVGGAGVLSPSAGAGSESGQGAPAGGAGGAAAWEGDGEAAEGDEARYRHAVLFRHMSWVLGPAATRLAVTAASSSPGPDGTVRESNALRGFLQPSAASVTLAPLLRALYCRQIEVVTAALEALTSIVEAGFFMATPLQQAAGGLSLGGGAAAGRSAAAAAMGGGGAGDDLSDEGEAALVAVSAWALLDVVAACVVDATLPMLDQLYMPLLDFMTAVMGCAGAADPLDVTSSASSAGGSGGGGGSAGLSMPGGPGAGASGTRPPCGLHPATLTRALSTAFSCHTFSRQKRIYAERGWLWCERAGQLRDAEMFQVRLLLAKRTAAWQLGRLRALVRGLVLALERDAAADPDLSLATLTLAVTGGLGGGGLGATARAGGAFPLTASLLAGSGGKAGASSSSLVPHAGGDGGYSALVAADGSAGAGAAGWTLLPRSIPGDYGELSRAFASHTAASSSFAAEVHVAAQPSVLPRPFPALYSGVCGGGGGADPADAGVAGTVPCSFDPFRLPARSPTADVAVMLALLAKTATEPLVFSAPGGGAGGAAGGAGGASGSGASGSGGSGAGGGGGGGPTPSASAGGGAGQPSSASTSFKRLTSVLQRDTALFLLGEVFSAAGPALAASPLLVACVSRLVVPAIFSHLLSPRIAHATLSICTAPSMVDLSALAAGGAAAEAAGVSPSVAALAASAAGPRLLDPAAAVLIPPTSLYRGVLQVIGALWSARGAEEAASLCAQVAAATAALIAAARPANAFAGRGQVTSSLLLSASTGGGLPLRAAHGHSASAASIGSGFGAMLSPSGMSATSPGGTSSAAYSSLPSLPSQAHAHLPTGSGGGLQLPSTAGRGGGGGSFPISLSLSASPALSAAAAVAAAAAAAPPPAGGAARGARLSGTSAGSSSTLRPSLPANLRESCAREVSALLRGVLLHTLASKTAPHALKLDAVEEASRWLGTPQALMELWINHDTWPSAGAQYPHTRTLRSLVATLVGAVLVRPRSYIALLGGATSGGEMVQVIGGAEVIVHPDALPITATPQERGLAADAWQREEFRKACATLLCGIVRGLMDSAATVHLPPSSSSASSGAAGASSSGSAGGGGGAEGWEEMDARPAAAAAAAGLSIQQALAAWGLTAPAAPVGSSGGAAAAAASSLAAAATRTASFFFGGGSGGSSAGGGSGVGGAAAAVSAGSSSRDLIPTHRRSGSSGSVSSSGSSSSASAATGLPAGAGAGAALGGPALVPVRVMHGRQTALESALLASLPVFRDRGVKKGLALLTAAGVVHASPRGVAHFLRLCGPSVAPLPELGDYLGDEGRGPVEKAAMAALRHEFFAGFSFSGMAFDAAMRLFLTKGGFRLPGEAQKIERITQAFSGAYYSANRPSRGQMEAAGYSPADIAVVEALAAGIEEARATQFAAAAVPAAAPAAAGAAAAAASTAAGVSSVQGTPDKQGRVDREDRRGQSVEGEAAQAQQQQQPGHEEQAAQHAQQQQQPGDTAAGPLERQPEEEAEEAPKRKAPKPVAAKPPPSLALGDGRFYPTALDVVEVLTFSCIMLNTDAHNRNIKRERKMTRRQFLSNNRHIDGGHDLPAAFLTYLYDAITGCEIRMGVPGVGSAAVTAPAAAGPLGGAAAGGAAGGAAGEALHFATPIAPPVPLPAAGSPAAAHVPCAASMIAEQVLALPAGGSGSAAGGGSGAGAGKAGGGAAELGGPAAAAGAGGAAGSASAYSAATAYLAYLSGPLPGALALGEGGAPEPEGAVDAGAFASGLSDACWRWINHLCAGAKYADADAAGSEGGGVGSAAGGSASGAGAGAGAAAAGAASGSFSAAISTAFLPPAPATGARPSVPFVPDPYASTAIPYRRNFSVSTVACALVDLWPHIMRLAIMILRLQPPRGPALALGAGPGGARGGSGAAASPSTPASVASASAAGSVGAGTPGVAGAGLGAQHAAAKVANKRNSFAFFSFGSRANMAAAASGAATPTGAAAAAAASSGAHAGAAPSASASTAPPSPGVDAAVGGGYAGSAAPAPIPVAALRATTPSENEVRLLALDSLKYALSAALFLGLQRCIVEGADALLQVEAATLGPAVARESATNADSGWHAIVTRFARSRAPGAVGGVDSTLVAEAISVLHVVVAEMREAVTSQTEAANVEAVAERFRGDMARELAAEAHTRRLLLEGDLTKVAAEGRGKHTVYRFFLFTDMLVYAEKIAGAKALFGGGGKFTVHQRIPLGQIRSVEACAELTAQGIHTGFRVSNGVKPLILYAGSEAEARAWKRQINEAVAAYVHGDHDGFAAMGGLGGTVASAAAAAAAVAASQGTQGHNTSIGSLSGAGGGGTVAAAASARRNSVLTTFRRTSDIGIGAHAAAAALREGLAGAHVPSATAPAGSLAGVGVGGGSVPAGGGRPGGSKLAGVAEARSPVPSAPSALRSGGGGAAEGAGGLATPGAPGAGSPGGGPAPPPRLRSDGSAAGTSASGTPVPPPAPPRSSLLTARPSLSTPESAPAAAAASGARASVAGAIGLAPDSDDDEEGEEGAGVQHHHHQHQLQQAGGRPSPAPPVTASVSSSPAALDTVPEQGERTVRRSARRRRRGATEEAGEGESEGEEEEEEDGSSGSSADSPAHEVVGSPSAALSSSFPPQTFQPASPHAPSDAAAGEAVGTPVGPPAQQPRQLSLPGSGDGSIASPLPSPLPGGSPGSAGSRSAGSGRRSTTGPRRSAIGLSSDSASPGGSSAAAGGMTPAAAAGSSAAVDGAVRGGTAGVPTEGVGGELVLIAASRSGSAESFYTADASTPALGLGSAGSAIGVAGASTPAMVASAVAALHAAPPMPPPHGLPRAGSSSGGGGSGRRSLGVIVAPRGDHGSSAGSLLSTLGDAGPVRDAAPPAAGGVGSGSPMPPAAPASSAAFSSASSLLGAAPAPDRTQLFESIAELKIAFLHAVAFCRPLLSSDVAAGGTALGPAGSRQEGSFASPSATLTLHDGDKLSFYSYFKQATQGDCPDPAHEDDVSMMLLAAPPAASGAASSRGSTSGGAASARSRSPSPVRGGGAGHTPATLALAKAKRDAWRRCSGMRRREAMRAFVLLLDRCVPGWDAVSVMPGSGPS